MLCYCNIASISPGVLYEIHMLSHLANLWFSYLYAKSQAEPLAVVLNNTAPPLRAGVDWADQKLTSHLNGSMSESFSGKDYLEKVLGSWNYII